MAKTLLKSAPSEPPGTPVRIATNTSFITTQLTRHEDMLDLESKSTTYLPNENGEDFEIYCDSDFFHKPDLNNDVLANSGPGQEPSTAIESDKLVIKGGISTHFSSKMDSTQPLIACKLNSHYLNSKKNLSKLITLNMGSYPQLPLSDLEKDFDALCALEKNETKNKKISLTEKIAIAACKQFIVETIHKHLKALMQTQAEKELEEKNNKKARFWKLLKKIAFFALLGSGLGIDSFGSFEGSDALFRLVPGMLDPVALGFNIAFSLINSILFVAFEGGVLQKAFGISLFGKAQRDILKSQISVINTTDKINVALFSDQKLIDKILPDYPKYASITAKFNNDAKAIKDNFVMPVESKKRKALRYFISGFGAFMFAGWACYTAYGFLGAALLASGYGGIIVAAVIVSSLVYYYVMQAKGVHEMMNPTMGLSEDLKVELDTYQVKEKDDFDLRYKKEIVYEKSVNEADLNAKKDFIYEKYNKFDELTNRPAISKTVSVLERSPSNTSLSKQRNSLYSTTQKREPSISKTIKDEREHRSLFQSKSFSFAK